MFLDINNSTFGLIVFLFLIIVLLIFGLIKGLLYILGIKIVKNKILKYFLLFMITLIIVYIVLGLLYKITGKGLLEY
jgi:hypothetical protein